LPAWGTDYRTTPRQITKGYELFITNIALPIPNEAERLKAERAQLEYTHALDLLSKEYDNAAYRWKRFDEHQQALPPGKQMPYDQWYATFAGPRISIARNRVNLAAQKYSSYINKAYKGFAFASTLITDYNNPAFMADGQDPDGSIFPYRKFSISPDLNKFIEESKKLAPTSKGLDISFKEDSKRIKTEDTVMGGGGFLSLGLFNCGASGSKKRYAFNSKSKTFRMQFTARRMGIFTITPGQWMNPTAIQAFKNGHWIKGGPVETGQIDLWGRNGVLNLMPAHLVVAFRPRTKFIMDRKEYEQVRDEIKVSGAFSIGPVGFGASYGKKTQDIKFDEATNSITAEDNTDTPQIIAVVSNILPDFE
jgi:hypothetical protein